MSRHILNAIKSLTKAQEELERTVTNHGKIIKSQGEDIANLGKKVASLRNCAIKAEIANNIPTKDVATKYGITSARVSQIAPRKITNN